MDTRSDIIFSPRLLMLILWGLVIYAFSEIPGTGVAFDPPLWYVLERKAAHVFEYAILMFFSWRYFTTLFPSERLSHVLILAASFSLVFGVLDELHQWFTFGRAARFTDVLIDALGIAMMTLALFVWRRGR